MVKLAASNWFCGFRTGLFRQGIFQRRDEGLGGWIPLGRLLGQGALHHLGHWHGYIQVQGRQVRRWLVHVLVQHRYWSVSLERYLPRQQLEENDAQGIQVRLMVHGLSAGMLGGHVVGCTDGGSQAREAGDLAGTHQSKISQHGLAAGVEDDVGRLDVTVDESLGMGVVQGVGDGRQQLDGSLHRHGGLFGDELSQRGAGQISHGDEVGALDFAYLVYDDDVGVMEVGCRLRLLHEALDEGLVTSEPGVQDLEGDFALKVGVQGLVDRSEAAVANFFEDFVFAEMCLVFHKLFRA